MRRSYAASGPARWGGLTRTPARDGVQRRPSGSASAADGALNRRDAPATRTRKAIEPPCFDGPRNRHEGLVPRDQAFLRSRRGGRPAVRAPRLATSTRRTRRLRSLGCFAMATPRALPARCVRSRPCPRLASRRPAAVHSERSSSAMKLSSPRAPSSVRARRTWALVARPAHPARLLLGRAPDLPRGLLAQEALAEAPG